jgi:cobaltochelatase CobS
VAAAGEAPREISPDQLVGLLDGSTLAQIAEATQTLEERLRNSSEALEARLTELGSEIDARLQAGSDLANAIQTGNSEQLVRALREIEASDDPEDAVPQLEVLRRKARPQHRHFPLLVTAVRVGVPAMLHGEGGSGKSEAAAQVSRLLGLEFRAQPLAPTMSETKFYGYRDATGNYHSTGFREIYEGGGVFLFDELDNGHPSTGVAINFALSNGAATFPDGMIPLHKKARFMAAANTIGRGATGQYVGRSPIDAATRDRFVFIPWDVDPELERALVDKSHIPANDIDISDGGIPEPNDWLDTVVQYREALVRAGIKQLCSPRATLYGVKLAGAGVGMDWLKELCIYRGMPEHDRQKLDSNVS